MSSSLSLTGSTDDAISSKGSSCSSSSKSVKSPKPRSCSASGGVGSLPSCVWEERRLNGVGGGVTSEASLCDFLRCKSFLAAGLMFLKSNDADFVWMSEGRTQC